MVLMAAAPLAVLAADEAPNVILIVTDDQGYGDMACHGNPWLKTPNLDRLREESVRLEDFHVDPVCTPTRAALMTGRYGIRTGAWAVVHGRQLLRRDEVTMADVFAAGGYRTGIFGKWHLGDGYPYAPRYRGFQESVMLRAGGIGEIPDAWGNDYFDDRYWDNGVLKSYEGYCTDVFMSEAMRFIGANRDRRFFVYLPFNAMHSPHNVAEEYVQPYREAGVPEERAKFYGMIANFDENLGRLLGALERWGLEEKTLVVFFGDNGTSVGAGRGKDVGFNAGMGGNKGTVYEGGHRVACFLRWPGRLEAGREVRQLTAHRDLLPTLIEICGLKSPEGVRFDGRSLVPLLRWEEKGWPERVFVVDRQGDGLGKWKEFAVLSERWRMVNGELYDVQSDPGQGRDVAARHPDVVKAVRAAYEGWWADVAGGEAPCPLWVGAPEESPALLTARDWHPTDGSVPWRQETLADAERFDNGYWVIGVARPGRYALRLSRFPQEADQPMGASEARIRVGDDELSQTVAPGDGSVTFEMVLTGGQARLQTWLKDARSGKERGAYYVGAIWLGNPASGHGHR
jgi:uncharacterized sulfatase